MPSMSDLVTPIDQAPPQSGPALFLEFARRGRPGWWWYAAVIPLALVLTMVVGIVLGTALTLAHVLSPADLKGLQDPSQTAPYFSMIAATFGLFLMGFWAASRLIQGKRFGDIIGRWRWDLVAKGFGLWALVLILNALADYLMHPQGFSLSPDIRSPQFMLWVAPALALQTFAEEFVFRGVITQALVRLIKQPWIVCLVSGLVFGSMHIPNGLPQAVSATAFGVVLAFVAIRTGGLALGWGVHLVNNLFGGMIVVSGGDVFKGAHGLFHQNTPGLDSFDVVYTVAALVAAAWFLLRRSAPQAEVQA